MSSSRDKILMENISQFAVICGAIELRTCYSGIAYSGKQRNIYEHIYKFYSPNYFKPPPHYKNILALRNSQRNICTIQTFWFH